MMTKKRLIEILEMAYEEHTLGYGLCNTLFSLYQAGHKISTQERFYVRSFLYDNYRNGKLDSTYWLSSTIKDDHDTKKGTQHRKNILLDAIAYISVTGHVK